MTVADVDPELRAGVTLDAIAADRARWEREHRRPRALTARDALIALEFEALVVMVAAGNLANGIELTAEDRDRLHVAWARIDTISNEVIA